jgi:hypothetical protein
MKFMGGCVSILRVVFEHAVDCFFSRNAPVCGGAIGGDLRVGLVWTLSAGLKIRRSSVQRSLLR